MKSGVKTLNTPTLHRRAFVLNACLAPALALAAGGGRAADSSQDPWRSSELIQPEELASILNAPGKPPQIICVTFPILYGQRHIPHAIIAGPGKKPEGIEKLLATVSAVPKNAPIVIYCGCCPMNDCPNIRPAYLALKKQRFEHLRVLNLPANFHTDWVVKGYPVEPALSS